MRLGWEDQACLKRARYPGAGVALGAPFGGREKNDRAGQAGGCNGDQLVHHGFPILPDLPIGLER
jgi:hypothetical protein